MQGRLLIFVMVALIASGLGLWLAYSLQQDAAAPVNQAMLRDGPLLRLPEPKTITAVALYDDSGEPFSLSALEGDWTLVFFGFTSCPHVCPDTLYQLTDALSRLEVEFPSDRVPRILFVGVDPERDTPDALSRYRERFSGRIEAVSGPDAQLRALAMQVGVHYVVPEHEPGTWYNVDHTVSIQLVDPEGRWAGVLSAPHDGAAIADALGRLLNDA